MNPETALRWLGITPWVPRSGVPTVLPVPVRLEQAAQGAPLPSIEPVKAEPVHALRDDTPSEQLPHADQPLDEVLEGAAVARAADCTNKQDQAVQPVPVMTNPPTLWLINLLPDQPLVAAILRALPSPVGWQSRTEAAAEPSVQWGEQRWPLSALQSDGRARRALWRQLHPQSAH